MDRHDDRQIDGLGTVSTLWRVSLYQKMTGSFSEEKLDHEEIRWYGQADF